MRRQVGHLHGRAGIGTTERAEAASALARSHTQIIPLRSGSNRPDRHHLDVQNGGTARVLVDPAVALHVLLKSTDKSTRPERRIGHPPQALSVAADRVEWSPVSRLRGAQTGEPSIRGTDTSARRLVNGYADLELPRFQVEPYQLA